MINVIQSQTRQMLLDNFCSIATHRQRTLRECLLKLKCCIKSVKDEVDCMKWFYRVLCIFFCICLVHELCSTCFMMILIKIVCNRMKVFVEIYCRFFLWHALVSETSISHYCFSISDC